jgi:hypothetical protein
MWTHCTACWIITWYSDSLRLESPGIESLLETRFSAPAQNCLGTHQIPVQWDTGSFLGEGSVKRPGCGIEHPLASSDEVKERVQIYLYFPPGPSWFVLDWTSSFLPLGSPNDVHNKQPLYPETALCGWFLGLPYRANKRAPYVETKCTNRPLVCDLVSATNSCVVQHLGIHPS